MNYRIALIICALSALLTMTACGTNPVPLHEARSVPQDRKMDVMPVKSSNPATLTLLRDKGLLGAEHTFQILVNGLLVARLNQSEKVTVPVEPGQVFIEVQMFNILGKIAPVQVETTFESGKHYYYRAGIDDTPKLHLRRDLSLSR